MYFKDYKETNTEFNLLKLYKKVLIQAFVKHSPQENLDFISYQLGISTKTLHRMCKYFDVYYLIENNKIKRKLANKVKVLNNQMEVVANGKKSINRIIQEWSIPAP